MLKKFTWGHGVVLMLGSFIAFILFMIIVFPNGKQNAELVSDDYYADELQYQQVIDAKNNADQLTEKPIYQQNDSGISIVFPETIAPENGNAHFELFRTNDSNLDVKKDLALNAQHTLQIPKQILVPGSYTLKIKWTLKNKPYQIDYDIQWK